MEMDWSFTADEDFGFAKSFSDAPVHAIAPGMAKKVFTPMESEASAEQQRTSEVRSEGFNFTLAPVEDQVHFQRHLKQMAPKMTDFSKGTTTLAFEFKEGVLVAVDARATQGAFISSN